MKVKLPSDQLYNGGWKVQAAATGFCHEGHPLRTECRAMEQSLRRAANCDEHNLQTRRSQRTQGMRNLFKLATNQRISDPVPPGILAELLDVGSVVTT